MHFPLKNSIKQLRKPVLEVPPILPDYCAKYPNVWSDENLRREFVDLLVYFNKTFLDNNIDYSIAFGTALGYVRHNDFIPWDDDFDIVIKKNDSSVARYLIKPPFCTYQFWGGWKLFKCHNKNAGNYPWKYPFVDVFDTGNSDKHRKSAYDNIIFPSAMGSMNGLSLRIPKNLTKHLTLRYGSLYMQNCQSPIWDHKNEKGVTNVKTFNCSTIVENCYKL